MVYPAGDGLVGTPPQRRNIESPHWSGLTQSGKPHTPGDCFGMSRLGSSRVSDPARQGVRASATRTSSLFLIIIKSQSECIYKLKKNPMEEGKEEETKEIYAVPFEVKKLYSVEELQGIHFSLQKSDRPSNSSTRTKMPLWTRPSLKQVTSPLTLVLVALGEKDISDDQVIKLTASVDFNNDSVIQFSEFLELYRKLVSSKDTHTIEKLTTKEG